MYFKKYIASNANSHIVFKCYLLFTNIFSPSFFFYSSALLGIKYTNIHTGQFSVIIQNISLNISNLFNISKIATFKGNSERVSA